MIVEAFWPVLIAPLLTMLAMWIVEAVIDALAAVIESISGALDSR